MGHPLRLFSTTRGTGHHRQHNPPRACRATLWHPSPRPVEDTSFHSVLATAATPDRTCFSLITTDSQFAQARPNSNLEILILDLLRSSGLLRPESTITSTHHRTIPGAILSLRPGTKLHRPIQRSPIANLLVAGSLDRYRMASQPRKRHCQRQPLRRCDRAPIGQLDDDPLRWLCNISEISASVNGSLGSPTAFPRRIRDRSLRTWR